jgi:hypothetical protein
LRLIQAKVRSTIHRLGKTSKPLASDRFTISSFHAPVRPDHERHLFTGIATVSKDALDEWEQSPRPAAGHTRPGVLLADVRDILRQT